MNQNNNISLCICTYNRVDELEQTLESILVNKSELISGDEILIVDNNSNDTTSQLIEYYSTLLPVVSVFEKQQGLSCARNAALKTFKNPLIIFIDDDISITDGFFAAYRDSIDKYPETDFFGGKILVDWGGSKPNWFRNHDLPLINGLLVYYNQSQNDPVYTIDSLLPYGANFALRRELVESNDCFDTALGVNGNKIGRGEETEYMMRALNKGFSGRFVGSAVVLHRYKAERLTTAYLYQYGFQKGLSEARISDKAPEGSRLKAGLFIVRGLYQLIKNRNDRYYQCVINAGMQIGKRVGRAHNSND